jgi:hypothetical protein
MYGEVVRGFGRSGKILVRSVNDSRSSFADVAIIQTKGQAKMSEPAMRRL